MKNDDISRKISNKITSFSNMIHLTLEKTHADCRKKMIPYTFLRTALVVRYFCKMTLSHLASSN